MIFNTLAEVTQYIEKHEPETLNGFGVSGELFQQLRDNAENARAKWWPNCKAFGYMEEYYMGEGEYMEINENGMIVDSNVYF